MIRIPSVCSRISGLSIPLTPKLITRPFASYPRHLAIMSQTPSKACCETPPVTTNGYQEKGQYITVDGLKTYNTGPKSSAGILVIYDIFGFFPQTLQGADILSGLHHKDTESEKQFKVFMPDFFDGKPADISWYPPDTDEKGKKLGEFFQTTAAPPKAVSRVGKVMQELQEKNPDIKAWGVLGYCWGGKIVNLVSQKGTVFKCAATAHPAMVDPKDASEVTIPMLMIPTKDEDKNDVANYEKNLKVTHDVQWFDDQIHGFLAARSDLKDDKVKAAYEKGYSLLASWFTEHL